jgi:hypothetical protein
VLAIAALAVLVAGCTVAPKGGRPTPTTLAGTVGSRPATPAAALMLLDVVGPAAPAAPPPKLLCDAPSLTYLVGHKRTDIPVPADLSRRRVACTTCPGSEDHQPERTDILFDAKTGLITAVTCG